LKSPMERLANAIVQSIAYPNYFGQISRV
jgi:hypothetical protein